MSRLENSMLYANTLLDRVLDIVVNYNTLNKIQDPILRRCISDCYYAVFHITTVGSANTMFNDQTASYIITRSFDHDQILKAYKAYLTASSLKNPSNKGFELFHDSEERAKEIISLLAEYFELLQKERHRADYDFSPQAAPTFIQARNLLLMSRNYTALFEELQQDFPVEFNRLITILLFKRISKVL